jgi:hypothetical protein
MKKLEKIVLHPKLENEHRAEVTAWLEQNANKNTWDINSNYDEHGCFNITLRGVESESLLTMFLMKYKDTKIVEQQYYETYEIANEALALFDFGD